MTTNNANPLAINADPSLSPLIKPSFDKVKTSISETIANLSGDETSAQAARTKLQPAIKNTQLLVLLLLQEGKDGMADSFATFQGLIVGAEKLLSQDEPSLEDTLTILKAAKTTFDESMDEMLGSAVDDKASLNRALYRPHMRRDYSRVDCMKIRKTVIDNIYRSLNGMKLQEGFGGKADRRIRGLNTIGGDAKFGTPDRQLHRLISLDETITDKKRNRLIIPCDHECHDQILFQYLQSKFPPSLADRGVDFFKDFAKHKIEEKYLLCPEQLERFLGNVDMVDVLQLSEENGTIAERQDNFNDDIQERVSSTQKIKQLEAVVEELAKDVAWLKDTYHNSDSM